MIRVSSLLIALALVAGCPFAALAQEQDRMADTDGSIEDFIGRPFLEIDYGFAQPKFKDASFDFASLGLLEFKLGYSLRDSVQASVVSLAESFLFASFVNTDLGASAGDDEVGSKLSRFGFGNRMGHGYQGESMGLDLYNLNSMHWTKLEPDGDASSDPEAQAIFDRYGSSHRFGVLTESGVKLGIRGSLALTAGIEGAIIYPRYVFWPWLGSALIYSSVQGIVEVFADDAMRSSPQVGPVLYFLLKSGVSLAYYLAVREDMNWPFDSETPLTMETFKIGSSFTF